MTSVRAAVEKALQGREGPRVHTHVNRRLRTFASFPPVMSVVESADQSTQRTICLCLSSSSSSPVSASHTLAEKSPDAVAARVAGMFSAAPQTAPLWPSNVPIQSPVSPERIIAVLSWHAEMRKTPSSVSALNSRPATGRLWPGHISGCEASTHTVAMVGDMRCVLLG